MLVILEPFSLSVGQSFIQQIFFWNKKVNLLLTTYLNIAIDNAQQNKDHQIEPAPPPPDHPWEEWTHCRQRRRGSGPPSCPGPGRQPSATWGQVILQHLLDKTHIMLMACLRSALINSTHSQIAHSREHPRANRKHCSRPDITNIAKGTTDPRQWVLWLIQQLYFKAEASTSFEILVKL